jgi:serine/threonine-protein kinase
VVGNRYQIRGLLGKGGMGQVFLCLDQTRNMPVALKVLDTRQVRDPKAKARFILEAQSAAKITHPNVIEVHDVGLHPNGTPYIAMEMLFGESLGSYLKREKVMAPEVAVPYLRQVALALGAAHRAGVIHRDVKPDNVFLIGEKGAAHTIKVLDFSLARNLEFGGFTAVGVAVGTVDYMAPEQICSDMVDARTDVYGLGVLMYRIFAGRIPFKGREAQDTLALHLIEPAPPMNLDAAAASATSGWGSSPLGLASALEAVIQKCLRKHPDNRYPSMAAVLADLDRLLPASGALTARNPILEPDVYIPKNPFGMNAARLFYNMRSKTPPPGIG